MSFRQRLFRYMIGVSIGLLVSLTFFKDRLGVFTSWLPANRIKARFHDAYVSVSPKADCQLTCMNWSMDSLKLYSCAAEVDFAASEPRGEPKTFELQFAEGLALERMRFSVRDSNATILELQPLANCDCP